MKFRFLLYTPLLISIIISCTSKTPQEYFSEFESLYTDGKTDKAIKTISRLIEIDSTSTLLYNARGLAYLHSQEYDLAIADFSQSLKLDNENIYALAKRGESKYLSKNYVEAIVDLKEAVILKGFNPVSDSIFDYKINNLELFLEPSLFDIIYQRGLAYYNIYELFMAYDDFNICIEGSVNSRFDKIPECYFWRGMTYKEIDQKHLACQDFKIAAESGITEANKYIEELCN